MFSTARKLLLFLFAAAAGSLTGQDTPVESAANLLGEPIKPEGEQTLKHVSIGEDCKKHLVVGDAKLSKPDGKLTIKVSLKNVSDRPVEFEFRSAFFRSDGSIVPTPYPHTPDPVEGMARGFVGLISLGASEVTMELETSQPTIETTHTLEAGKELIVEHQLPWADENVVGARAFVAAGASFDPEHESEVRRTLEDQYWKARDQYFAQRKVETQRWDRQRKQLEAEKEDLPALSAEYKKVMKRYWEEHRNHLAKMQEIESRFDRFREEQKQRMTDELSPSKQ